MAYYRDEGVALRTFRLGEADRIVTFVTPEHGKVRAVAKGVRRTKSKIGARVEPLSHVQLICWRGRELDTINQVEVLDSFRSIRDDLDRIAPAMTMLEIADQVAVERQAAPELFSLLVGALRALEKGYSPVILGAFCFKLLTLDGVGPSLDSCTRCGEERELVAFDPLEGSFVCASCRRGQAVSKEVLELVRASLVGGLGKVLEIAPSEVTSSFERLGTLAVEHHLTRRLRSARQLVGLGQREG